MMENKKVIPAFGILALVLIMIVMVFFLFLPYASVLLWASIIYILTSPFYNKVIGGLNPEKRGYGIKKRIIAAFFSVLAVVLIVSVVAFVVIKVFGQGKRLIMEVGKTLIEFLDANKNNDDNWVEFIKSVSMGTVDLSNFDLKKELLNIVATYSERILAYTTNFVRNIGLFVVSLAFLAFSLYFFYVDGEYLLSVLKKAVPIDSKASTVILLKIKEVTNNLFKGLFLVSFYQSLIALFIYLIFGIEGALLLAILTFFSSFLPLIGCGFVWVPVGVGLFFSSGVLKAVVFLVVAGLGISSLDNLLRPFFLKDRIKIHPFLIFFSMLGGVKLFSFNGIVLGPMIIILFFTVLDIALEAEEKHELDKKIFE